MRILGAVQTGAMNARFQIAGHMLAGVSTVDDLARGVGVPRRAVQRFLDELCDGGHAERLIPGRGAPAAEYAFTDKGRAYLRGELARWVRTQREDAEIAVLISTELM